jgi:hypothetical protein
MKMYTTNLSKTFMCQTEMQSIHFAIFGRNNRLLLYNFSSVVYNVIITSHLILLYN